MSPSLFRSASRIPDFVARHFRNYRQRSPWSFCWRITVEGFLLAFGLILLIDTVFPLDDRDDMEDFSLKGFLVSVVFVGPIVETLLLQSLPIFICRLFRASFPVQVLASTVVFALPHFASGIGVGIGAGVVGGFYSAFTYAHWRESSRWTAFWVTTVSHMLHNGLTLPILFFGGELQT